MTPKRHAGRWRVPLRTALRQIAVNDHDRRMPVLVIPVKVAAIDESYSKRVKEARCHERSVYHRTGPCT